MRYKIKLKGKFDDCIAGYYFQIEVEEFAQMTMKYLFP